jgi:hypothetical protein
MKKQDNIMLSQSSGRQNVNRTLEEIAITGNRHQRRAAKAISGRAENSGKQMTLYSGGLSGVSKIK